MIHIVYATMDVIFLNNVLNKVSFNHPIIRSKTKNQEDTDSSSPERDNRMQTKIAHKCGHLFVHKSVAYEHLNLYLDAIIYY